jgi:DNA-binding transcriptional LysR family regulator
VFGFRAVAALPRRLAENCAEAAGRSICPVPLPSDGYDVRMVWNRRTNRLVAVVGQGRAEAAIEYARLETGWRLC